MDTIFNTPDVAQVMEWYKWLFSLNNKANPFHPINGEQYWKVNNTNKEFIWLAGITATTQPAYQPSQISNVKAIVEGSQATAVYNDGNGNPEQNLPTINPRNITIDKGDTRDLYIPVSTELATATKWPKLVDSLSDLAQKIIDREDVKGAPPAFAEFVDAEGNKYSLNGSQLKTRFRVNGTIDKLDVPSDNVGMNPSGNGPAAFSDYVAILPNKALKPGINTLRFGVDGKFFGYTVEYKIKKM